MGCFKNSMAALIINIATRSNAKYRLLERRGRRLSSRRFIKGGDYVKITGTGEYLLKGYIGDRVFEHEFLLVALIAVGFINTAEYLINFISRASFDYRDP